MVDRRQQILSAAREIAAEDGMASLSVRHVAARAGIGASTLRHYFPSQGALYDAVVGDMFHAQLDDLRITDLTVPPGARLTEVMLQFLPPTPEQVHQLHGWFALYAAVLGRDRDEPSERLLTSLVGHARDRIGRWLEVLENEGALRAEDRDRHITMLTAMVDGLSLALLAPGATVTLAQSRTIVTGVVHQLLLPQHAACARDTSAKR